MQNNNFLGKHLRGNSSLQETKKGSDESVTLPVLQRIDRSREFPTDKSESVSDNWVRGLGSVREDPRDSLHGD